MSRKMSACGLIALLLAAVPAGAQEPQPEAPDDVRVKHLPRQQLSGPRFGLTVFTGDVAEARKAMDLQPVMTQFGWQWETQIVSTQDGNQALMEWVALVGGVEQSEFNASLAWLAGYRLRNGLEFGVGPNVSYSRDNASFTTSMQVAGGATLPFGDLWIPLNVSVGLAEGGPRLTALIGWIVG